MKNRIISLILIIAVIGIQLPALAEFQNAKEEVYDQLGQNFTPLNLREVANRGFADDVAGDGKGGWTDQGSINDLRNFTYKGINKFGGVDFNIIDPEENNGNSCVVLRGQNDQYLPTSVDIPVNAKGAGVYFLHASGYISSVCGYYTYVYDDGTDYTITIRGKQDVFNWWGNGSGEYAITAWSGSNNSTSTISLYLFAAENPYPEKTITKITAHTTGSDAYLMLVAATLTDKGPYLMTEKDRGNRDTSNWYAYTMPSIKDIQGTVLDMSFALDAPAGKHGYIKADGDHLYFDDGTPARFWGVNLGGETIFLRHERIDTIADRIAALGFNLVRFHHMDAFFTGDLNIYSNGTIKQHFDDYKIDNLCYTISAFRKRGIYIFLDQTVSGRPTEDDNHINYAELGAAYKKTAWFDEASIEGYERYTKNLMTRYNPYTGCTIAEDPSVVFIDLANESNFYATAEFTSEIYQQELDELFNNWLVQKYGTNDKLKNAWEYEGKDGLLDEESLENKNISVGIYSKRRMYTKPRQIDIINFISDTIYSNYERQTEKIRSYGYKGLITPCTMWGMNLTALGYVCAKTGFLDSHRYWSHPSTNNSMKKGTTSLTNKPVSMMADNNLGILGALCNENIFGKPHTISEWEECQMNPHIYEGSTLMAAYASMQNWQPLYFALGMSYYEDIDQSERGPQQTTPWDETIDNPNQIHQFFMLHNQPIQMATMPSASLMYVRGDIKEADKGFYNRYSQNDYFSTDNEELSQDPTLGMIGKTGTSYDGVAYDSDYNDNDVLYRAVKTKENNQPYVSVTGEMSTDMNNGVFQLNTERSQAVVGAISNKSFETDDMITSIDNEYAGITIVSLSDKAIWETDKMLLTAAGDARNTGEVRNSNGTEIIQSGGAPILVEPITGSITLKTQDDVKVYKISSAGLRKGEAKTEKDKDGNTVIYLCEEDECMNYEIVRENKNGIGKANAHIEFEQPEIKPLFDDLDGYEWAQKQITRNVLQGIMRGISETSFSPGNSITKGDFTAAVITALGISGSVEDAFTDVEKESSNYAKIALAKQKGLVEGDENGNFNPNNPVSRQDAMKILAKAMEYVKQPMADTDENILNAYSDTDEISAYAKDSAKKILSQKYAAELWKGELQPYKAVTRAETAYILYGILWY